MLRVAVSAQHRNVVMADFAQFFAEFLEYGEAPPERPYVIPFSLSNRASIFGASNYVAGSYAASSLRPEKAFRKVVSVSGRGKAVRYSLPEEHASAALEHLLFGRRVPAVPLSIFLYRDYGMVARTQGTPEHEIFVNELVREFGLAALSDGTTIFDRLFEVDPSYLQNVPITQPSKVRGAP
jgi:hypothetical protein